MSDLDISSKAALLLDLTEVSVEQRDLLTASLSGSLPSSRAQGSVLPSSWTWESRLCG